MVLHGPSIISSDRIIPLNNSEYCSTREAAILLGISLRTAQLWVENGVLLAWKTAGGHRRILRQSVTQILDERKRALREPVIRQQNMLIVVVEDDFDLRKLFGEAVKKLNLEIEVKTAQNGFEGLILIGQIKPDLVIIDLNMSGIDGFRMVRALYNSPEFTPRRLVVSTTLNSADIEDRGGLPANVTVLPKPTPFSELEALIRAERGLYPK